MQVYIVYTCFIIISVIDIKLKIILSYNKIVYIEFIYREGEE